MQRSNKLRYCRANTDRAFQKAKLEKKKCCCLGKQDSTPRRKTWENYYIYILFLLFYSIVLAAKAKLEQWDVGCNLPLFSLA